VSNAAAPHLTASNVHEKQQTFAHHAILRQPFHDFTSREKNTLRDFLTVFSAFLAFTMGKLFEFRQDV